MFGSTRYLTAVLLATVCILTFTNAITEDDNVMSMRDANASRERPRIEGYDMDDTIQ